jgi:hypothetical protein
VQTLSDTANKEDRHGFNHCAGETVNGERRTVSAERLDRAINRPFISSCEDPVS